MSSSQNRDQEVEITKCASASDKIISHDFFATQFNFRLPKGKDNFYSKQGFCFTILLLFLLFWYGAMQSIKLFTFDDTDVMVSTRDAFFTTDEEYSEHL